MGNESTTDFPFRNEAFSQNNFLIQKLSLILFLACSIFTRGADFYRPRTFSLILDSFFSKSWTPNPISEIGNRSHILILDSDTQQYCLSVTEYQTRAMDNPRLSCLNPPSHPDKNRVGQDHILSTSSKYQIHQSIPYS